MDYPELAKLFHMDNSSNRYATNEAEYLKRKDAESTFLIEGADPEANFYLAMPREMTLLLEKITRTERTTFAMMESLPPLARAAVTRGLVLDEVVGTNAVENIQSTRKQVEEALESKRNNDLSFKRFKELALLYLGLASKADSDNPAKKPKTVEDIRELYDLIMEGELEETNKPDGKLFRASGVDVTAGGVKVIHSGAASEQKIVAGLESMLDLVYRDDIPPLLSVLASHYLFESIHPFYDGNGRTGRYLLALFLKETLSTPTVLSLSRTISENKSAYYAAFNSVENPLNHGELTHFVYALLELVRIAQSSTMERLQSSIDAYDSVLAISGEYFDKNAVTGKAAEIVLVLAQYDLFGMVDSVSLDELAEAVQLGKQMTRIHLDDLEGKGIVEKVSKRPLKFSLTKAAETALGIKVAE